MPSSIETFVILSTSILNEITEFILSTPSTMHNWSLYKVFTALDFFVDGRASSTSAAVLILFLTVSKSITFSSFTSFTLNK